MNPGNRCLRLIIGFALVIGHCACVSTPKPAIPDTNPRWAVNHAAYAITPARDARIEVFLSDNTAHLVDKTGTILVEMDCSPGIPEHPTPTGKYRITEKLPLKLSNLYGQYVDVATGEVVVPRAWEHSGPRPNGTVYRGIAMPCWLRLTDSGVGIHVGELPRGVRTSHGCIRCPDEPQRLIYEKVRVGTAVTIHAP